MREERELSEKPEKKDAEESVRLKGSPAVGSAAESLLAEGQEVGQATAGRALSVLCAVRRHSLRRGFAFSARLRCGNG